MRPVNLGDPVPGQEIPWIIQALKEIERASAEDRAAIADEFTLTGQVDTRSLNAATATTTQVAQVLATLLRDMQNRGSQRSG